MALPMIRRSIVFCALTLATSVSGPAARGDALYTITNLGSGGVTLGTAGGGAIAVSQFGSPDSNPATSQLASVSNGQVTYSFATTADTQLVAGQGPLSGFPVSPESLGLSPSVYGSAFVTGLLNTNGFAALALTAPFISDSQVTYAVAYAAQENSGGTLGQPVTITTSPPPYTSSGFGGWITIAGVNSANQAILGTTLTSGDYDTLVYNLSTHSLTDLDLLPQFSAGPYSNLRPLAIDNQGQILLVAATGGSGDLDILLLTPSGEPIVTTPEPSTCITWALIAGASWLAAKRRRIGS